jgi:hypothetical protein
LAGKRLSRTLLELGSSGDDKTSHRCRLYAAPRGISVAITNNFDPVSRFCSAPTLSPIQIDND